MATELVKGRTLEKLQVFVPISLIHQVPNEQSKILKQDPIAWAYLRANSHLKDPHAASYWYTVSELANALGWKRPFTSKSLKRLRDDKFLRDSITHKHARRTLFLFGDDPRKRRLPIPGSLLHAHNIGQSEMIDVYVWMFMRSRTKFTEYETTGTVDMEKYAKYMEIHRTTLLRAIKRLKSMGFLEDTDPEWKDFSRFKFRDPSGYENHIIRVKDGDAKMRDESADRLQRVNSKVSNYVKRQEAQRKEMWENGL